MDFIIVRDEFSDDEEKEEDNSQIGGQVKPLNYAESPDTSVGTASTQDDEVSFIGTKAKISDSLGKILKVKHFSNLLVSDVKNFWGCGFDGCRKLAPNRKRAERVIGLVKGL